MEFRGSSGISYCPYSPPRVLTRRRRRHPTPILPLPRRALAVAPLSALELSFVYELVYFIAGTCFPRKFQTSRRSLACWWTRWRTYYALPLPLTLSAAL